ncbi:NUDIX hydrolase [Floccifex sp.]|uniref:NUDIX hydrolase n=1 Tax=Floccifex sp. TaxID=2815810 RepID=UPI003F111C11
MKEFQISSETIFEGKVVSVYRDQVQLENGMPAMREVVSNAGGVCVLALTEKEEIILVQQFRYPSKEELFELPGGRREQGEEFIEAGARELKEETGYVSDEWEYFGYLYPTVAYCSEVIHMVVAKNCHFEKQCLDPGEFVVVHKVSISKIKEMILKNEIKDAKTLIACLKFFMIYEK